jgi:hypothetical protein
MLLKSWGFDHIVGKNDPQDFMASENPGTHVMYHNIPSRIQTII